MVSGDFSKKHPHFLMSKINQFIVENNRSFIFILLYIISCYLMGKFKFSFELRYNLNKFPILYFLINCWQIN